MTPLDGFSFSPTRTELRHMAIVPAMSKHRLGNTDILKSTLSPVSEGVQRPVEPLDPDVRGLQLRKGARSTNLAKVEKN